MCAEIGLRNQRPLHSLTHGVELRGQNHHPWGFSHEEGESRKPKMGYEAIKVPKQIQ